MDESRRISEKSRSVVRRTAQAVEVTGGRAVVQRSGAWAVGGTSELVSEMSTTGSLSIEQLPARGAAGAVDQAGSSASSVRVLKSPDGYGSEIRAIFGRGNVRVMKGAVIKDVQAVQGYLQQACVEARRIAEEGAREVEKAYQEAREAGRREAFEEVLGELGRARSEYDKLMRASETDMVELALHIARQIIGYLIEVEPTVMRDIVAKSLVQVRGKSQIVVLVHPEDLKVIEKMHGELAQQVEGAALYFGEDPRIERGGCVIETESGRLDARLDVQLDVLRGILLTGEQ